MDSPNASVQGEPGNGVIDAANHGICVVEVGVPQDSIQIALERNDRNVGIEVSGTSRDDFRLALPDVFVPKQYAAGEIRGRDPIVVNHSKGPDADKREVLDHLVAQGPSSNHDYARAMQPTLRPSGQALPIVSTLSPYSDRRRIFGQVRPPEPPYLRTLR